MIKVSRLVLPVMAAFSASTCSPVEYSAEYRVPESRLAIGVFLRQSNPPLAEYHRWLFMRNGEKRVEAEMGSDTGGRSIVNLFRVSDTIYQIEVNGNEFHYADFGTGKITRPAEPEAPKA